MPVDLRTTSNEEIIEIIENVMTNQLGEFNDIPTREKVIKALSDILPNDQEIGIIVCDENNNPPEVIDRNALNLDYYFKRLRDDQYILIQSTIVPSGVQTQIVAENIS